MSPETREKTKSEEQGQHKSWWQTIPGILGGIAGIITATATLVVAVTQAGLIGSSTTEDTDQSSETIQSQEKELVGEEVLPISMEVEAVVVDPNDNYVNIRAKENLESQIITRVGVGETVYTIPHSGEWWPVRTQEDRHGYIHRSRTATEE
ncbi:MAG: SH3 domain-containing protein [Cyanobacteria bacterium P01_D01_bin.1]